jgi:hypothetical protein
MGGVRIDVKDLLSWPDIDDSSRWGVGSLPREDVEGRGTTVRVSGTTALWLAGQGHWVKIPRAKITDKSKADTFQKILVLIQVSWMIMQCIARWMYKLPLTLLEIHTMVHVVCAMILYGFWFKVCPTFLMLTLQGLIWDRNRSMFKTPRSLGLTLRDSTVKSHYFSSASFTPRSRQTCLFWTLESRSLTIPRYCYATSS